MKTTLPSRYRVVRSLGRGRFGEVFLVEDQEGAPRRKAFKLLDPEQIGARALESFDVEFAGLADCQHPNLVRFFEFGTVGRSETASSVRRVASTDTGRRRVEGATSDTGVHRLDRDQIEAAYFTMEYVKGVNLAESWTSHSGDFGALEAAIVRIFRALSYIHGRDLIHGDLKPENVLIVPGETPDDAGRVLVLDFGLASLGGGTARGAYTPGYTAPELFAGAAPGPPTDLYALGVTLFVTIAGELPVALANPETSRWSVPPDIRRWAPKCPESIAVLLQQLLQRDPKERFRSAAEALASFAQFTGRRDLLGFGGEDGRGNQVPPLPLLPRDGEREAVEETLAEIEGGRRHGVHVVAISGEPGVGKRTLFTHLKTEAQVSGWEVLEPGVDELLTSGQGPLILARELVRAAKQQQVDLAARVPGWDALVAQPGADDALALLDHLAGAFEVLAAEQPLLLGLPGGRELPAWLLAWCRTLVRRPAETGGDPIRGLVAFTTTDAVALEGDRAHAVALRPLTDAETAQALDALFGVPFPEPALKAIQREAGGNPGILEDLLRAWVTDGVLSLGPEGWDYDESKRTEGGAPADRLNQLYAAKMRGAGAQAHVLLVTLDLLGGNSSTRTLKRIVSKQLGYGSLNPIINELRRRGVVTVHASTSGPRVKVTSRALAQTAREQMASVELSRVGRATFDALDALAAAQGHQARPARFLEIVQAAGPDDELAERVAEFAAQMLDERHHERACQAIETLWAWRDSVSFAPADLETIVPLWLAALRQLREFGKLAEVTESLLEEAEARGLMPRTVGITAACAGAARYRLGETERAVEHWNAGLEAFRQAPAPEGLVMLAGLAHVAELKGDAGTTQALLEEARYHLTQFKREGVLSVDDLRLADFVFLRGRILARQGDTKNAQLHLARAAALCRQAADWPGFLQARMALADLAFSGGELDSAETQLGEVAEIAERFGHEAILAKACATLGSVRLYRGALDEARRHYARGLPLAQRHGDAAIIAEVYAKQASVARTAEEALAFYAQAYQHFASQNDIDHALALLVQQAEFELWLNDIEGLKREFQKAEALTPQPPSVPWIGRWLDAFAALGTGNFEPARALLAADRPPPEVWPNAGEALARLALEEAALSGGTFPRRALEELRFVLDGTAPSLAHYALVRYEAQHVATLGRHEQALEILKQVPLTMTFPRYHPLGWQIPLERGTILLDLGRPGVALEHFVTAFETIAADLRALTKPRAQQYAQNHALQRAHAAFSNLLASLEAQPTA